MGTCRFILTNYAETATVKNGTGGSPTPPARTEVSPFVMERALNSDRRSLWKLGAANAGTEWQVDLDLGSAKAVDGAAVHGISCPGGTISAIWVGYVDDTVYPSIAYVPIQALTMNGRDAGLDFASFTKRYWFFLIYATAAPVLGRLVLGPVTDLGLAPNFGALSAPRQNRLEQVGEDGSVTLNVLGHPGHDFELEFNPCTQAKRDAVAALHNYPGTLTYFDPEDRCFETILRDGRPDPRRVGADAYSVSLEMTRLP